MNVQLEFRRRLGAEPQTSEARCAGCYACPDVWELESGDFAIIGKDITADAIPRLPAGAGCGPDERVVLLPRNLLITAKRDIPDRA